MSSNDGYSIVISRLSKHFGDLKAVNNVDLRIKRGEIFGLLGPNGAGKTTILNIILGLLEPTSGHIIVEGFDSVKEAEKVKPIMGFMTQETVVDSYLTAYDNLEIAAQLYHVPENEIRSRIDEALKNADLAAFASKPAGTFSGGMQRRLNLVKSMIQRPKILILDEPTTGLDVQSRLSMWEHIRNLRRQGITTILTTQYLEEADSLCDRIAIIDHGQVKAIGTSSELKRNVAKGNILEITAKPGDIGSITRILRSRFGLEPVAKNEKIDAVVEKDPMEKLMKVTRALEKEKIEVLAISLHLPTLDDVFIRLTGSSFRDSASGQQQSQMLRAWKGGR